MVTVIKICTGITIHYDLQTESGANGVLTGFKKETVLKKNESVLLTTDNFMIINKTFSVIL